MKKIKKIFWEMAKHHCLIFLILVIFGLVWGVFLFYKNFILIKEMGPGVTAPRALLDKKLYQEISETLKNREENLKNIEEKTYLNPFELR